MNKQERAAGILALCLVVLTLLWYLAPRELSSFSLRMPPAPTPGLEARQRLNINEAAEQQLRELPGIGEVLARSIVQWRQEQGPFDGPEDLLAVAGIGEATLAQMEPYITY